jgi:hypothetical protein
MQNISLDELSQIEKMTEKSYYFCKRNMLTRFGDILYFYNKNKTFRLISSCSAKVNKELLGICKKYLDGNHSSSIKLAREDLIEKSRTQNISLDELKSIEELSERSYNICIYNSLKSLKHIINYYEEYGHFFKLRNGGIISNRELVKICEKYINNKIEYSYLNSDIILPIQEKVNNLSILQKEIINAFILNSYRNLSRSSKFALESSTTSTINIEELSVFLEDEGFDYTLLRNIGKTSKEELIMFFQNIFQKMNRIISLENVQDLLFEKLEIELNFAFEGSINFNQLKIESRYFPIFKFIDLGISKGLFYKSNETEVFRKGLNIWADSDVNSLVELGEELSLTRERIRQIREKIIRSFYHTFSFLKTIDFELINFHGLNRYSDFIIVSNENVEEINEKEGTNFNQNFISIIYSIILEQTLYLCGNVKVLVDISKGDRFYNWDTPYLIDKGLAESIFLDKLMLDINQRLSSRIIESYSLNFQAYISNFLTQKSPKNLTELVSLTEQLIYHEFDISLDLYDDIVFQRNTSKATSASAKKALLKIGKPAKLQEIIDVIAELYPEEEWSKNKLRSSLLRANDFVSFGRSSVYGLKIWEDQKKFKAGTIKDIVEEYLMKYSEPKHIDDITKYVKQFRETTAKNIYSNLQQEKYERFIFYKNLHVGLIHKKYDNNIFSRVDKSNTSRSWEESYNYLVKFIRTHQRIPINSGEGEELKLYRFFRLQVRLNHQSKLDSEESKKIEEIESKFNLRRIRINKTYSRNKNEKYDKLRDFIIEHNRQPNSRIEDESRLYTFLYTQNRKFKKNSLTKDELDIHIEILKIINDIDNGNRRN